jgi:hypothetical protein
VFVRYLRDMRPSAAGWVTSEAGTGVDATPGEWVSTRTAAQMLGVSERTMQSCMGDPVWREREWGAEFAGWRRKPVTRRVIYQLRRSSVQQKIGRFDAPETSQ